MDRPIAGLLEVLLLLLATVLPPPVPAAPGSCPRPCSCPHPVELHCTFRSLVAVPTAVPKQVERMNLGFNSISRISETSLGGLRRLELLMVHGNEIQSLPDGAFRDLAALQMLKMSYNKLTEITRRSFQGLWSLARLHLDHNRLESIHPDAFQGLTSLRLLQLEGNRLQQLHPATFATFTLMERFHVSTLKHLHLSDNRLTRLHRGLLAAAPQLESLHLHGNPWSCDCDMRWFHDWREASPDVLKCKKDRALPGGQLCPACSSPRHLRGKELPAVEELACSRPLIDAPHRTAPSQETESEAPAGRDVAEPFGHVSLGLSDEHGNEVDLECSVWEPEGAAQTSWEQVDSLRLRSNVSLSVDLDCPVDREKYEQLWRLIAYYSSVPAHLERGIILGKEPHLTYEFRQDPDKDARYYTGVRVNMMARPEWLMQTSVGLQLNRLQSSAAAVKLTLSTSVSEEVEVEAVRRRRRSWVMIRSTNASQTALTAALGSPTQMDCVVHSSGQPLVQWVLPNGSRLAAPQGHPEDQVSVSRDGSLLLKAVSHADAGTYHCVSKVDGDSTALPFHLTVQEVSSAPPGENTSSTPLEGFVGSPVSLPCVASGSPDPDITWILPNRQLVGFRANSSRAVVYPNGTVHIPKLQTSDGGFYKCVAMNQHGVDTWATELSVVRRRGLVGPPQRSPSQPQSASGVNTRIKVPTADSEGASGDGEGSQEETSNTHQAPFMRRVPAGAAPRRRVVHPSRTMRRRPPLLRRPAVPPRVPERKNPAENRRRVNVSKGKIDPEKWADILAKIRDKSPGITATPVPLSDVTQPATPWREMTSDGGTARENRGRDDVTKTERTSNEYEERSRTMHEAPDSYTASDVSPTSPRTHDTHTAAAPPTTPTTHHVQHALVDPHAPPNETFSLPQTTPVSSRAVTTNAADGSSSTPAPPRRRSSNTRVGTAGRSKAAAAAESESESESESAAGSDVGESSARGKVASVHRNRSAKRRGQTKKNLGETATLRSPDADETGRRVAASPTAARAAGPEQASTPRPRQPASRRRNGGRRRGHGKRKHNPSPPTTTGGPSGAALPSSTATQPTDALGTAVPFVTSRVTSGGFGLGSSSHNDPEVATDASGEAADQRAEPASRSASAAPSFPPTSADFSRGKGSSQPALPEHSTPGQRLVSTLLPPVGTPEVTHETGVAEDPGPPPAPRSTAGDPHVRTQVGTNTRNDQSGRHAPAEPSVAPPPTPPPTPPAPPSAASSHSDEVESPPVSRSGSTARPRPEDHGEERRATPPQTSYPLPTRARSSQPAAGWSIGDEVEAFFEIFSGRRPSTTSSPAAGHAQQRVTPAPAPAHREAATSPGGKLPAVQAKRSQHRPTDIHPSDIHPTDIHPSDIHPSDIHPSDVHPSDIHPMDIHPTDIHPTDIHPSDIHPSDIHPTDIHPMDIHPTDIHPTDIHPTDIHPSDIHPSDIHPTDIHPMDIHPMDIHPSDIHPTDIHPSDIHPSDIHPTDIHPSDIHPSDIHPTDIHPTDIHPSDIHPSDIHPSDIHPTDIHPSDIHPSDIHPTDFPPDHNRTRPVPTSSGVALTSVPVDGGPSAAPPAASAPVQWNPSASGPDGSRRLPLPEPGSPPRGKPRIMRNSLQTFSVKAETDAELPCEARGRPMPFLSWIKVSTGASVAQNTRAQRFEVHPNGTLIIRSTRLIDGGQYLCTVQNQYGTDKMAVHLVVLSERPRVAQARHRDVSVPLGGAIDVACTAEGHPAPRITWALPNHVHVAAAPAGAPARQRVGVAADGTLRIRQAGYADRGLYKCIGSSAAGADSVSVRLHVSPPPPAGRPTHHENATLPEGGRAYIHCPARGAPGAPVLWIAPDGTQLATSQLATSQLATGRNLLVFPNGTLLIREPGPADSGRYECVVGNAAASGGGSVNVSVRKNPFPAKASITSSSPRETQVAYGGEVTLHCVAKGQPEPRVIWRTPSKKLLDVQYSFDSRIQVFSNGSLTLRSATDADSGDYLCVARNKMGDDYVLLKVAVLTRAAKIHQKLQRPRQEVVYGGDLKVDCVASGLPNPEISWALPDGTMVNLDKNKHGVTAGRSRRYVVFDNGTLYLNEVGMPEEGDYTCYAENQLGKDEMKVRVEVKVGSSPPRIRDKDRKGVSVFYGETVALRCDAQGEPPPGITWISPTNRVIAPALDKYQVLDDGWLVVQKVQRFDAGNYTCLARNTAGHDHKVFGLDVLVTPPVINGLRGASTSIRVTAVQDQPKLVDCVAKGTPVPRIMWVLPGNVILPAPYYSGRMSVHLNGSLEVRSPKKSDSGQLACIARNEGGEVKMVVDFRVKEAAVTPPAGRPRGDGLSLAVGNGVTLNCSLEGAPLSHVTWILPNGTPLLSGARYSKFFHRPDGSLVISGPSAADLGSYQCLGRHAGGLVERTVTLSPGRKPEISNRYDAPVSVVNGGNLQLHCQTAGEPLRLAWTLPTGVVLNRPQRAGRYAVLPNGTLAIQQASVYDRGPYVCRAANEHGSSLLSVSVTVVAHPPRITSGPPAVTHAKRGVAVQINCVATGMPKAEVAWETPDKMRLAVSAQPRLFGNKYLHPQGSLIIQNPTQRDAGLYRCTARNAVGTDSKTTFLNVF